MKGKITAIIVDDEPEAQDLLNGIVEDEFPEISIRGKASNVDQGIELILKQKPNIVFLDIQMPKKNGFELLHELQHLDVNPTIIFITAFDEFAIEAIRHSAFDYLQKPFKVIELKRAISRYKKEFESRDLKKEANLVLDFIHKPRVKFNTRSGFILIDPDEVLYCLADGNYTEIYLRNGQDITVSINLSSVKQMFNNPQMLHCGRSHLIHSKYIVKVNRKERICILKAESDDISISITKQGIKDLEKYLESFNK